MTRLVWLHSSHLLCEGRSRTMGDPEIIYSFWSNFILRPFARQVARVNITFISPSSDPDPTSDQFNGPGSPILDIWELPRVPHTRHMVRHHDALPIALIPPEIWLSIASFLSESSPLFIACILPSNGEPGVVIRLKYLTPDPSLSTAISKCLNVDSPYTGHLFTAALMSINIIHRSRFRVQTSFDRDQVSFWLPSTQSFVNPAYIDFDTWTLVLYSNSFGTINITLPRHIRRRFF